jgi:hypothetical protein
VIAGIVDVDRGLPIITIQVGKETLENVLLDGGSGVNLITKEEEDQLPSIEEDLFAIGTIPFPEKLVGASSKEDHPSPYPNHFSTYTKSDIEVDDTHVRTQDPSAGQADYCLYFQ